MSKLGLVIEGAADLDAVVAARPRVAAVQDDPAALLTLHDALGERVVLLSGTAALGSDWAAFWRGPAGQHPEQALDLWWEAVDPDVEAAPFAFWRAFSAPTERALLDSFTAFEVARVERLAAAGARACVGSLRTGQPDFSGGVSAWEVFLPACRAARIHGGVLGVEEFGALYMWLGYAGNEWLGRDFRAARKFPETYDTQAPLALHYRATYRDLFAPLGLAELPLVITACGLGRTADDITAALSHDGQPTGGWRSCRATWHHRDGAHDPEDFYLRQLQWYDAQLERDPQVIGAAVYGLGTGDDSALEGRLAADLLRHINAGPHLKESIWPVPTPVGTFSGGALTAAPAQDSGPRQPGKRYYITAAHPEIFDVLWRQGEPKAAEARALFTWREEGGSFTLHMDDEALWQELYLYGQMMAQQLGVELDGGELEGGEQGTA